MTYESSARGGGTPRGVDETRKMEHPRCRRCDNQVYNQGSDLYWAGSLVGGGTVGTWTTDGTHVWRASANLGVGRVRRAARSLSGHSEIPYRRAYEQLVRSQRQPDVDIKY